MKVTRRDGATLNVGIGNRTMEEVQLFKYLGEYIINMNVD